MDLKLIPFRTVPNEVKEIENQMVTGENCASKVGCVQKALRTLLHNLHRLIKTSRAFSI